jgi:SsrA-binding protein
MKIICNNKKASFEYFILDTFEAGIKLKGTEIKSIRQGKCNINDAYVIIKNNKVYLLNSFIAKYDYTHNTMRNEDERRTRELLLHKHQILKLQNKVKTQGFTIVATKLYFVNGLVKVEIALAKGKNIRDKRETIKKRDLAREKDNN